MPEVFLKKTLLILSVVYLNISESHGSKSGQRSSDPLFFTKFCFVKKEIPANLTLSFGNAQEDNEGKEDNLTIRNSSKIPFKLFLTSKDKQTFTKSLKPNHLPISLMIKDKVYSNSVHGFALDSYKLFGNPLSSSLGGMVMLGASGQIKLSIDKKSITQKELDTFVEIPLQYYYGDKFIENKIKIFSQPAEKNNFKGRMITKLEFAHPLPPAFTIKPSERVFEPDTFNFYSSLVFSYSGMLPLLFVKEFKENIEDLNFIKDGLSPYYLGQDGKCFKLNEDPNYVIPRDEGRNFYDTIYNKEKSLISNAASLTEEYKAQYLKTISEHDLLYMLPIGYTFPGNGKESRSCDYRFYEFSHLFEDKRNQISSEDEKPKEVNIPQDEIIALDTFFDGKMSKFHLIKRAFLNTQWMPASALRMEGSSCAPFCPKIFAKEEINYIKDLKINYPQYQYKDEELICGMLGKNGYAYVAHDENDDFSGGWGY